MKKWTQCDEVVRYMTIHGAITQQEADRLGIKRLASRINDLRNDGYAITTENVKVKSRFGDTYVAGTDSRTTRESRIWTSTSCRWTE